MITIQNAGYLVIRSLAYFPSQCARNSGAVMEALLASAQAQQIRTEANSLDSDAAVIWSVLWRGRMQANQAVYQHYRSYNRPVVVVDIGALRRGVTWKIAVNHVTAQGHYGHEQDLDWDRPQRLGIALENRAQRPEILFALQNDHSLQVEDVGSMSQWLRDRVADVGQHSDRPLVVRPHPRYRLDLAWLAERARMIEPRPVAHTYDSFDLDCGYHAVVNHNSGPGIQAALAGARPLVSRSSLAHPVAIDLAQIEKPYAVDRQRWLVEICHTEYTLDEIRTGTWLKRLATWL